MSDFVKDANVSYEDTISRQAAIDALRAMQTYKLFAGDDMLLIDQAGAQTELMLLPPAPQWHLMSETPEIENDYLVTIRGAYGGGWIEIASYNRDDGWDMWSKELDVTDCIAWAELPEPYKEDRNR